MDFIWTEELKSNIISMLDEYFMEYGNSGCIAQGDEAQIRASEIMCTIADIIMPIK